MTKLSDKDAINLHDTLWFPTLTSPWTITTGYAGHKSMHQRSLMSPISAILNGFLALLLIQDAFSGESAK
jgi:hypothetical protein